MNIVTLLTFCGIPTAVTGFFFWLIKRHITKQATETEKKELDKEQRALEREKNSEKLILMLMQSTRASIVLSEATARAVQRIPDAHCNGDMHKALEYASKVQNDQKNFLMELGIHSIYE